MLSVRGLSKDFGAFAVRDVSFDVGDGAYFALLGFSGVGKTLLLELLAGLIPADSGIIELDGKDITAERIQRRRFGLVYQDQALFPHMTVFENTAYGLRARGQRRNGVQKRVNELMVMVGVAELAHRHPGTLSGGEAQRVAVARALATEPRCLLLDEPLSSLDRQARSEMRALLRNMHRQGRTVLHVTHDYEEAVSLATQVGIMEDGAVVQTGEPRAVFHHPKSEFVARFVGIKNFYSGRLEADGPGRAHQGDLGRLGQFVTRGLVFKVLSDAPAGPGHVILRSEDVTVSNTRSLTSAQNMFAGTVTDLAPARLGVEVIVDIGVPVAALVTQESTDRLDLRCGHKVWVSFKASALRFIEV